MFKTLNRLVVILAIATIILASSPRGTGKTTITFQQNSDNQQSADPDALNEFKRLVGDDYQIKDLFYSGGLKVIFEK